MGWGPDLRPGGRVNSPTPFWLRPVAFGIACPECLVADDGLSAAANG